MKVLRITSRHCALGMEPSEQKMENLKEAIGIDKW